MASSFRTHDKDGTKISGSRSQLRSSLSNSLRAMNKPIAKAGATANEGKPGAVSESKKQYVLHRLWPSNTATGDAKARTSALE